MEGERGHHHRSELFICFTSRPPSLKTSSKSTIRGRPDKPTSSSSLSTSLSRRLRSNGSIKGGQSPMFPASVSSTQRKKGGAFEAPEPSSPKVTCIGQVRVKTMKKNHHHNNHLRSRSRRRGGEVSFRKGEMVETTTECLPSRNQRWVHLPLSVCEALRAFGAEISCLFPSCGGGGERRGLCGFGRERGEKKKRKRRGFWVGGGSCGAALARWLMVVEEEEKRVEEMGVVVRRREEEDVVELVEEEGMVELVEVVGDGEEEEKRVSICIPPRNALLLMRCRSDPWKMSALTSKFWGSPEEVLVGGDDDEDDDDVDDDDGDDEEEEEEEEKEMERLEEVENPDLAVLEEAVEEGRDGGKEEEVLVEAIGELKNPQEKEEIKPSIDEISGGEEERVAEEETQSGSSAEVEEGLKNPRGGEEDEEAKMRDGAPFPEVQETHQSSQAEAATQTEQDIEKAPPFHEDPLEAEAEEAKEARAGEEEPVQPPPHDQTKTDEKRGAMPPECLLLMMCEPKLSMEVSKETWVETADFLRPRPRPRLPPVNKEPTENPISAAPAPPPPAPPPSSMATAVEQRLVSASAHEPFVLTRCKSEPMRSSAKLAPQACFWKARHRPIGAAGLGF